MDIYNIILENDIQKDCLVFGEFNKMILILIDIYELHPVFVLINTTKYTITKTINKYDVNKLLYKINDMTGTISLLFRPTIEMKLDYLYTKSYVISKPNSYSITYFNSWYDIYKQQ